MARDVAFAVALGLWRGAGTRDELLQLVPVLARDVIARSGYDHDAEAEAADIAERARTLLSVGHAGYEARYGDTDDPEPYWPLRSRRPTVATGQVRKLRTCLPVGPRRSSTWRPALGGRHEPTGG